MNKQQKQIAIIAAGALALYLLYRWYQGRNASASTAGTPASTATDYAALAGQEQSDVAALQGQNSQLLSQEQGDVASLQGDLGAAVAQEQSDLSGVTGSIAGVTAAVDALAGAEAGIEKSIAAVAAGQQAFNRSQTITTKKGGAFYKYYVKVTGHPPPARVNATNFIYTAWKSGINATGLQKTLGHPSAPKNRNVAHPNGNHTAQNGTHRKLPTGGATPGGGSTRHSGTPKGGYVNPGGARKPPPKPPTRRAHR